MKSTEANANQVDGKMKENERIPTERIPEEINNDEEDNDYDEEEDEDYDPTKKIDDDEEQEEDEEADNDDEGGDRKQKIDYSAIESSTSQVRTRAQRLQEQLATSSGYIGNFETDNRGLVIDQSQVDVDSIFDQLKSSKLTKDVLDLATSRGNETATSSTTDTTTTTTGSTHTSQKSGPKKIKIETNYTFAGKLITETKLVDEDSREAQAYLSSISSITTTDDKPHHRTRVKVFRKDPYSGQDVELQIKLKRPSLIDKFLLNANKRQKLSTLEKSRLDWASFVDKRKIGDELKLHNKAGYLDKQEFLGRVELKRDLQYQEARLEERKKQLQQQQNLV